MALKNAYLQVRAGDKRNAVACGSELPSRLFKASRYEAYVPPDATLPFDAEFLRWMLSDGAGAALLQPAPAARGVSLRVDWIDIRSYAHEHATCMYAGGVKRQDGAMGPGWLDYPTFDAAGAEGALFLRQDVRQLDALIRLGIDGFFRLVDDGRLVARDIDHVVCHYSSQFFRTRILELLRGGRRAAARGEVVLQPRPRAATSARRRCSCCWKSWSTAATSGPASRSSS